jgi:hypothetical protein
MANRANHYEAAFEAYIRSIRVPCVAIDEATRAVFGQDGLKNPDFLLYPKKGPNLVVEDKGKQGKDASGRRPWENWVTIDYLDGLARWQGMFGPGFRAILAFAYAEPPPPFPLPPGDGSFHFRGRPYRFWAVGLDDYVEHLRSRGPAWKAVAMARAAFRHRASPSRSSIVTQFSQGRRPEASFPCFPLTSTTRFGPFLGYRRKSGFFTPPSPEIARLASSTATHGTLSDRM